MIRILKPVSERPGRNQAVSTVSRRYQAVRTEAGDIKFEDSAIYGKPCGSGSGGKDT